MVPLCDLHTHSVFSDGTCTPTQLVELAVEAGLSALALSDHNTIAGLPEFLAAAQAAGLAAVPGVELSTDYNGVELHILGLFLPQRHYGAVTELVADGCRRKEESNLRLVEALARDGYVLDYPAIKAATPNGQVNRAHIAAQLTRQGYTASISEAFSSLLSPARGYYQEPKRPDALETIRFLRCVDAVCVLAHPLLTLSEHQLIAFLSKARPCGLQGMETLYPLYTQQQRRFSTQLAEQFGLCQSGGSDFHGENKPDIRLGAGRGDLRVPMSFYHALHRLSQG